MNNKAYVFLVMLLSLVGCQTVTEINSGLKSGLNKLQGGLGVHSNIKEMHGIRIEAKSCELTEFRTILCRLVVTSRNQDRTLNLLGTGHTRVQDDTGKTYPARISFGDSAEGGQIHSVLIADAPYNVTLVAENISSQATEVRAVDIARMDIRGVGSVKLVLSSPPMVSASKSGGQQISSVVSRSDSPQISESSARKSIKEFRGVVFEAKSCELTEFRTILCRLVVTSRNQDRTLNLLGTGHTRVQDDTGKTYPARISFGDSAEGGQIHSVLIADTPYEVTLTAENISSRSTKVRAIDIARMDIRGVGSVKLILAHPPMIASQGSMNKTAETHPTPTGSQRIVSKASPKATEPTVTAPIVTAPIVTTPTVTTPTVTTPTVTTPTVTTPTVTTPTVATPSISKPQKPTPVSRSGQTEVSGRSTVSAKTTLPGCWNWSNGGYIVIDADGTARNGPFSAAWKANDVAGEHYTITWPSFVDTLSLSADGSALSGTNNYGFPISATRKSGKVSEIEGAWLWNNGVTMTIRPDSSISGGAFRGTWSKAGNNWVFEWPLVDTVLLATDGRSLSTKNQFGPATAKRDASCKGK